VPYEENGRRRMIRFLNPSGGWINLRKRCPSMSPPVDPRRWSWQVKSADGVILFGAVGESLLEYTLSHIRRGAERVGKRLQDLYICVLTAFHVAEPGEELAEMQRAVGAYVASECNIFALSVKDPNDLPADIRDDIMRFRDAYRTPDAPIAAESVHRAARDGLRGSPVAKLRGPSR
jgi:alkanesulfonate monooxygenase SsuD/methylene tetrahydromethanopterin reductase-like flavin-dependent oxidoreductase (luciferase family)